MRMLRFLISYALFSIFGIVLSLFIAQNAHSERIAFYGWEFSANLGLVMVGAAAFGFLLALLLLFPGRVASALHSRSLDREATQLERRLELLYDQRERLLTQHEALLQDHHEMLFQYQRLLAGHGRVLAERDHARKALTAASKADSGKQPIPLPAAAARPQVSEPAPIPAPSRSSGESTTGSSLPIGLGQPSERPRVTAPTDERSLALVTSD